MRAVQVVIASNEIGRRNFPPESFIQVNMFLPAVHGAMDCSQNKSFKLVCRCHQLLTGFLVKGHLPQVSHQSCLLANDKVDNETIPGAVHRTSGIYLAAEEIPRRHQ